MTTNWSFILEIVKVISPPLFALLGAYFGLTFGLKQIRIQRRLEFVTKQLNEFYSPLLGYQKAIRAKSELRHKISTAADEAWKEICASSPCPFADHEKRFAPFKRAIDYDNTQLRDELLPLYRQMLETFRNNYWLAEPTTQKLFPELSDFVELWNRWLADSIPAEVIVKLHHTEDRLAPFYAELENTMHLLRSELANNKVPKKRWLNFKN